MNKDFKLNLLVIIFLVLTCAYALIEPVRTPTNTLVFLIVFLLQFAISIIISIKDNFISKKHLLILFFLSRIIIFPMQPWLSDDAYTYIFQGRTASAGINVYEHYPTDKSLIDFRKGIYDKMGNKDAPAIYPPLTVWLFELNEKIANIFSDSAIVHFYFWKALLLLAEFLALLLFLKIAGDDFSSIKYYIFSPLPLVEIIGQGHNDGLVLPVLGLFLFVLNKLISEKSNITFHQRGLKPTAGKHQSAKSIKTGSFIVFQNNFNLILLGIITGAGFLIKLIPILMALPVLKSNIKLNRKLTYLLVILIFIIPIIFINFNSQKSVNVFLAGQHYYNFKAQFFSAPLEILNYFLSLFKFNNYWILAPQILNITRMAAIAICFLIFKPKNTKEFASNIAILFLITFIFSGKVHPWYFVPIIYLYSLTGNRAMIIALGVSMLSYYPYLFGNFTYYPFLDILIWIFAIGTYFYFTTTTFPVTRSAPLSKE